MMNKLIPLVLLPIVAAGIACTSIRPNPTLPDAATPGPSYPGLIQVGGSSLEDLVALPAPYDTITKTRVDFDSDNHPIRVYFGDFPPRKVYRFFLPEPVIAKVPCLQQKADELAGMNHDILAQPRGLRFPETDFAAVMELRVFTMIPSSEFNRRYGKVIPAVFEGCYAVSA